MHTVVEICTGCVGAKVTAGFESVDLARAWAIAQATEVASVNGWKIDASKQDEITVVDATTFMVTSGIYDYADIRVYWSIVDAAVVSGKTKIYDTKNPRIKLAHEAGEKTALSLAAIGEFSTKYVAMAVIQDAFIAYDKAGKTGQIDWHRLAREYPLT